jgi:hypothetical protein
VWGDEVVDEQPSDAERAVKTGAVEVPFVGATVQGTERGRHDWEIRGAGVVSGEQLGDQPSAGDHPERGEADAGAEVGEPGQMRGCRCGRLGIVVALDEDVHGRTAST